MARFTLRDGQVIETSTYVVWKEDDGENPEVRIRVENFCCVGHAKKFAEFIQLGIKAAMECAYEEEAVENFETQGPRQ